MSLRRITEGHRKLIVFTLSIVFLLVGFSLALAYPIAGLALYGIYTAGIGTAAGIFTYGNVKEQPKPAAAPTTGSTP